MDEETTAGPVGADGGALGLPFTGDADCLCACWLKAKPPTTAGEPEAAAGEPEAAFADGEACEPLVALAYEERALEDVVPEAAADGDADFVLMGVAEDWTVLDIRCGDGCQSAPDVRCCVVVM